MIDYVVKEMDVKNDGSLNWLFLTAPWINPIYPAKNYGTSIFINKENGQTMYFRWAVDHGGRIWTGLGMVPNEIVLRYKPYIKSIVEVATYDLQELEKCLLKADQVSTANVFSGIMNAYLNSEITFEEAESEVGSIGQKAHRGEWEIVKDYYLKHKDELKGKKK